MKTIKSFLIFLSVSMSLSCTQKESIDPSIDSQVTGTWTLVRIINGFSQVNQKAEDIGISETLTYKTDGTYQRAVVDKNGASQENGKFYTGLNPTKTAEKQAILYPDDKTTQPYSFRDGHLFLYQRGSKDATIADGSTYEYQR